jgi:hypothetical protein
MTLIQKILVAIGLALTGKNALATAATVGAAGITAMQLGADPLPWVIGAFGGTVVFAYRRPSTRAVALVNGGISILLGGIAAPWAASIAGHYLGAVWANDYVMAFGLSAAWPWLVPVVMNIVTQRGQGVANGR